MAKKAKKERVCGKCGSNRFMYVSVRAPYGDWSFQSTSPKGNHPIEYPVPVDGDPDEDEGETRLDNIEEEFGHIGVRGNMASDTIELNLRVCHGCKHVG